VENLVHDIKTKKNTHIFIVRWRFVQRVFYLRRNKHNSIKTFLTSLSSVTRTPKYAFFVFTAIYISLTYPNSN